MMVPWDVDDITKATGGRIVSGDRRRRFAGISIDSRVISASDLFVAVRGQVHDGHGFASNVVEKGVCGLVVNESRLADLQTKEFEQKGVTCVAVADTTAALGDLGAYHRRRTGASVIAITGSNGKTSTREMTAAVVSKRFETLATEGNLNNEFGLPLTLLRLQGKHRWAVVELGMNHFGEIRKLGKICTPNIGIITNVGPAHLEGVGSLDGVARAKAELLETVRPEGVVILNADDQRVAAMSGQTACRTITFGRSEQADVRALTVSGQPDGMAVRLSVKGETATVKLNTRADFMVSNALAAAAAGHALGMRLEEIAESLSQFSPVNGRMNILTLENGITVIDDTYNANPGSMAAAIRALVDNRGDHRGIMVLGDMLELGDAAIPLHEEIGRLAAESGVFRLYATGDFADAVAAGARGGSMSEDRIFIGAKEDILADLEPRISGGDWILVKGSRGMKMETVVAGLKSLSETGTKTG